MAVTFSKVQEDSTTHQDPAGIVFPSTPIQGNLLVVIAGERSGGTATNFTISGSGWTRQIATTTEQSNGPRRRTFVVWWKVAGASEPTNVTVDDGTANNKRAYGYEYSHGTAATWAFESSGEDDTGIGSTSPIVTADTASTTGEQLLVGAAGWRKESSTAIASIAFSGLSDVTSIVDGNNTYGIASAWAASTTTGVKSTSVSWTNAGHEGNAGLLVFTATETGDALIPTATLLTLTTFAPTVINTTNQVNRVQYKSNDTTGDPATAVFDTTPVEGNLIIATAMERTGTAHAAFTINGTGWTKALGRDTELEVQSARRSLVVYYKVAGVSEATSISIDNDTNNNKRILIQEFAVNNSRTFGSLLASESNDNGDTAGATTLDTGTTTSTSGGLLVGLGFIKRGISTADFTSSWTNSLTYVVDATVLENNIIDISSAIYESDSTGTKSSNFTITNAVGNGGLSGAILVFELLTAGTTVTPTAASLTLATFAPTVTAPDNVAITFAAPTTLTLSTFAPTVFASDNISVTPSVASLSLSTFAPTVLVGDNILVTPTTASLTLAQQTPTVTATANVAVTPSTASLTLTTFAPSIGAAANVTVTPDTASLTLTQQTPTVVATDNKTAVPGTASLTLSTFAPTVSSADNVAITLASPTALNLTALAPTVSSADNVAITLAAPIVLTLTAWAPTVATTNNVAITLQTQSLTTTLYSPTISFTNYVSVTPNTASLIITRQTPSVSISDSIAVVPGTASLTISRFTPTIILSDNKFVIPGNASLTLASQVPTVTVGYSVTPGVADLTLTAFIPVVDVGDNVTIVTPGTTSLTTSLWSPTVVGTNNIFITTAPPTELDLTSYPLELLIYTPAEHVLIWTGSEWARKTTKYWNGVSWEPKPLKAWTGSEWK